VIDTQHIGAEVPPYTVEVEKGRLRFFAKAIGETDPIYIDESAARAAGHRGLPAPPTFAFCLELETSNPFALYEQMGIDLAHVLHGEQGFTYYQPICAGDHLTFRSRIADIYTKKGGALEFVVKETFVTDQDGQRVIDLRSVLVVRNAADGQ
jgi:acyl dehydratase